MKKIQQKSIDKMLKVLNEFQALIIKSSFDSSKQKDICKKHGVSNYTLTNSVKAGVFTRSGHGVYKSNIKPIEPIHARKVIELNNESRRTAKSYIAAREKAASNKISPKPQKRQKRTFSFFGLFEIRF